MLLHARLSVEGPSVIAGKPARTALQWSRHDSTKAVTSFEFMDYYYLSLLSPIVSVDLMQLRGCHFAPFPVNGICKYVFEVLKY